MDKDILIDYAGRNALVEEHLYLVPPIAKRYRNEYIDLDDLVQDGRLGLIRAAEKHQEGKGPFSTYARIWIRAYIKRAAAVARAKGKRFFSANDRARTPKGGEGDEYIDREAVGGLSAEELVIIASNGSHFLKKLLQSIAGFPSRISRKVLLLRIGLNGKNRALTQKETAEELSVGVKKIRQIEQDIADSVYTELHLASMGVPKEDTREWLQEIIDTIREAEKRCGSGIIDEAKQAVPVLRVDSDYRRKIARGETFPLDPANRVHLTDEERALPIKDFMELVRSRGHDMQISSAYRAKNQGFYMRPGYNRGGADRVYLSEVDFTYSPEVLSYKYNIPINRAYKAKKKGFFVVNQTNHEKVIREGRDVAAFLEEEKKTAKSHKGRLFYKEVTVTAADHRLSTRDIFEKFCMNSLSAASQIRSHKGKFVRMTKEQYQKYCEKNSLIFEEGMDKA